MCHPTISSSVIPFSYCPQSFPASGSFQIVSCLENPRDGGAWWAAVCGVAQSRTRLEGLSSSSRLVITFLPRSKRLLISWLQSPSAVILEPRKIKSATVATVFPSICHPVKYIYLNICEHVYSFQVLFHYMLL